MSGSVLASQATRLSRRLLMLLMLKVTIFRVQASIYNYCDLNEFESGKPDDIARTLAFGGRHAKTSQDTRAPNCRRRA
jgi:hypothetical protein